METTHMIQIFVDWQGMYRWLLTDEDGHRLRESRYGFEAFSSASKDAEAGCAHAKVHATVVTPPGIR